MKYLFLIFLSSKCFAVQKSVSTLDQKVKTVRCDMLSKLKIPTKNLDQLKKINGCK